MRILILTDGIYPFVIGGMQKHTYYMAKYFLQNGIDLTIYHCVVDKEIPENCEIKLAEFLDVEQNNLFSSKCFKFPRLKMKIPGHYVFESYLYSKLLYNELIKEKSFDFIYIKGFSGWYTLNHKNGLPKTGIQFHGLEMFQQASSFQEYLAKLILRIPVKYNIKKADYVFSYGGKIKEMHLKLGCKECKIKIQHGGIDNSLLISESKINNSEGCRRFIFIGRNERRKGYFELKHAILKIKDLYDFQFSFIGDIDLEDRIISKKVKYYGTINEVATYFKIIDQHDVIVVPSISEGFPTVIIESMSRGLIPLATNVGAIPGVVNNLNGFLIDPGNIEQIVEYLVKIIEMTDSELLVKKHYSLKMIENNFNWDKLSKELLNFIESVR